MAAISLRGDRVKPGRCADAALLYRRYLDAGPTPEGREIAAAHGKSAAQALVTAAQSHGVEFVGETLMPFGSTDFVSALTAAKEKLPQEEALLRARRRITICWPSGKAGNLLQPARR